MRKLVALIALLSICSPSYAAVANARDFELTSAQYASTTDAAAPLLNFGGGNTVMYTCGWVKPESIGSQMILYGKQLNNTAVGYQWDIRILTTGELMFVKGYDVTSYTTPQTTTTMSAGTCYFVEAYNNGTVVGVSINRGTDVTSADTNTWRASSGDFRMGVRADVAGGPDAGSYYDGLMQSVVVVLGMPTSGERDSFYNSGAGVQYSNRPALSGSTYAAFWNGTEASGANLTDSVNSYTLTQVNTVGSATGCVTEAAPAATFKSRVTTF